MYCARCPGIRPRSPAPPDIFLRIEHITYAPCCFLAFVRCFRKAIADPGPESRGAGQASCMLVDLGVIFSVQQGFQCRQRGLAAAVASYHGHYRPWLIAQCRTPCRHLPILSYHHRPLDCFQGTVLSSSCTVYRLICEFYIHLYSPRNGSNTN